MMASPLSAPSSRSHSPSPSQSPLAKAATTIDDLTAALSSFSRAPTPDADAVRCCCGREDCEVTRVWGGVRAKLESRLVLSAEVGQALLQRHEAYVRRQDAVLSREASVVFSDIDDESGLRQHVEYLTKKLDTVTEENTLMESRINELLIKHESAEASTRTLLHELHAARTSATRLAAQHARSVGWETRLAQEAQEKDDMRQERDALAHRARIAEGRAAAVGERCARLQNEIHKLREEVHTLRATRAEFSKSVLHEARTRLEALQYSLSRDDPHAHLHADHPETTLVLESLVADNESLKRDVTELQALLVDAREEVRVLSDEVEERRAGTGASLSDDLTRVGTPPHSAMHLSRTPYGRTSSRTRGTHRRQLSSSLPHTHSLLSSPNIPTPNSYAGSGVGHRQHRRSPSGPAATLFVDDDGGWGNEDSSVGLTLSRRSAALELDVELDMDEESDNDRASAGMYRPNTKSLLLDLDQSRSRGVQTDPPPRTTSRLTPGLPSPRPSTLGVDAHESRSETSSINASSSVSHRTSSTTQHTSTTRPTSGKSPHPTSNQSPYHGHDAPRALPALIERVSSLLVRMIQADVRTLTNRLKRQHLLPAGGDARHISRTTVMAIVAEVTALRVPPGVGRDKERDDAGGWQPSSQTAVTHADMKALLKLFKDTFVELGMLREQVNEVIFDPGLAHKLRKEATEPEKEKAEGRSGMGGWMAPIQKLFAGGPSGTGASAGGMGSDPSSPGVPAGSGSGAGGSSGVSFGSALGGAAHERRERRVAPKLAPAISASSTTVNVEFASSGVRKTDTSDAAGEGMMTRMSSPVPGPRSSPQQRVVTGPAVLKRPIAMPHSASHNFMSIFAGAPQAFINPAPPTPALPSERWVALPKNEKVREKGREGQVRGPPSGARLRATNNAYNGGGATLGRSATARALGSNRLSRNVDAIIDQSDQEVPDFRETLLARTLRPRGLSDSSIHTTFMKGELQDRAPGEKHLGVDAGAGPPTGTSSPWTLGSQPSSPPRAADRRYPIAERGGGARSPAARFGRNLAYWATAATGRNFVDDAVAQPDMDVVFGSPREDGNMRHATWVRRGLEGRDI